MDVTQSLAWLLVISQPSLHKGFEIKPIPECTSARELEMTSELILNGAFATFVTFHSTSAGAVGAQHIPNPHLY